ncbi:hypothetical protein Z517_02829 [Fonsecaea pedrosoi CBS 271.37]|uniref:C2H2-type domain-containing protein n=1 Tax=Fonsecaea pedrosoi CBS 271.37 TaxID=1442368 RepID=A0A0D2HGN5_9EURO|nr:uncharacterized protein Z517_02829 [Fonsecaea pedrosoi CBS 271.37]KIW83584.1 hypothetical protein Z517_02829 [Fonsecaea pedrosoi CBS 271.37]
MVDNHSRPRQSVVKPAWPTRSNVYPALPHHPVPPVVSDSLHQAFVSIPDEGSASASALHSAYPTDPVLTGLQTPLTAMASPDDHIPRSFFSSSDVPFPDYSGSFEPYPFQHMQGDSQYSISSPGTSLPPRFVESSSDAVDGVTSHQPAAAPWNHLTATGGVLAFLSDTGSSNEPGLPPRHLETPLHDRTFSSASAQKSLGDSGYETRSRKSQHEVDSVMDEQTEMDDQDMDATSHLPPYAHSTRPTNGSRAPNATQRPQQRPGELECSECGYTGKTRSDLKKHCARHKREHKCPFAECARNAKGFATVNDLDRHLKAVHNINNRKTRSYKCCADGCNKTGKEWPRLDNFKQHLKKMHGEENVEHLLQASNKWYEQQHQHAHADETASLAPSIASASSPLVSGHDRFSLSDNNNSYSNADLIFNSNRPETVQMSRQTSHNGQVNNQDLIRPLGLTHAMSQQHQGRHISTATQNHSLRQPRAFPNPDINDMSPPTAYMPRAWSQADFSRYQDLEQLPPDFTNQRVNYHFFPRVPRKSIDAAAAALKTNFAYDSDQSWRFKRPNTIAVPDLDQDRMADFISPQELRHIPSDLKCSQEEDLGFVGSSTNPAITDSGLGSSPHQSYQVNISALENSSKSELQKAMEEEIHSFLERHRSKGGSELRSDEEILTQFRLSLHGSDALTSYAASSVGPRSRTTDAGLSGGMRSPATRPTQFRCHYEGCKKVMPRQSELNKHMKRHQKPYGCVYDGCTKTFGSKDDWKRHERNQHEQQECWHCHLCFRVFFHDSSHFVTHMQEAHSIPRPEELAPQRRVSRNHQGRFWCGFCKDIIVHPQTDTDAIAYRFGHIANHFMKENKSSKEWVELTGNGKTKGALSEERKQSQGITAEEDEDIADASQTPSCRSQSSASQQSGLSPTYQPSSKHAVDPRSTQQKISSMGQTHGTTAVSRTSDTLDHSQTRNPTSGRRHHLPRKAFATVVTCCQCDASYAYGLSKFCMMSDCQHAFCDRCVYAHPKGAV